MVFQGITVTIDDTLVGEDKHSLARKSVSQDFDSGQAKL